MATELGDSTTPASGDDPTELFDVVDEDDRVIGQARRGEVHGNRGMIHRSVQILVFDAGGRLLLQRRSPAKDLFPGYWCASASGHVAAGDGYAETAVRELREELGATLPLTPFGKCLVRSAVETEITALYAARGDGPFTFHPIETDGGTFFSRAAIHSGHARGSLPLTPALLAALGALEVPAARDLARALGWHRDGADEGR